MPWVSYRELRRIERERREAIQRAESAEKWSRGLVNSMLTARGHSGVFVTPTPEKHYASQPVLPETIQGWTKDEFVTQLTSDGTYKSQAEANEAWQAAQATGRFPYQQEEEFLT